MSRRRSSRVGSIGAALAMLGSIAVPTSDLRAEEGLHVTFGHVLADFNGPVRLGDAPLAVDPASGEVLAAEGRDVKVFNEYGMQVFRLRTPRSLATVLDLAVEADGSVITLARDLDAPGDAPRIVLTRHDFRGVPTGEVEISGAPAPFDRLLPNRVFSRGDRLVLVNTTRMLGIATLRDGTFERGYDFAEILGISDDERDSFELTGFDVDPAGNLLATCAVMFRAFEISPDAQVVGAWGQPGSARGTFGVVAGITRDAQGRTYVADKTRAVVMIFDEQYRFLDEIPGEGSHFLRLPTRVLVDPGGRLYVTQIGNRGVWVFDVRSN